MYNLTQKQQEILSLIVQYVRNGKMDEEFILYYSPMSGDTRYFPQGRGPAVALSQGILDAFVASDVMLVKDGGQRNQSFSLLCTLRGKAYEAVDSNFGVKADNPNLPSLSILGPLDKKYKYSLFILMPFIPELKPVYDDHIKKVAAKLNLSIARADDFFSQNSIMEEVWSAIAQATILIADCTGKNPNVFYEIGLAHAINKPVILITQNPDDVPFDLRHRRYIKYSYTPRGMEDFERNLSSTILETQKDFGASM
jgi:hypothetical protein